MTINNLERFIAGLWDWGILDGCFGTSKIKPTDVDAMVERRGNFLVIEGKGEGITLPYGQQLMFRALHRKGGFTIITLWGKPPRTPTRLQVLYADGRLENFIHADVDTLRRVVAAWYEDVNKREAA